MNRVVIAVMALVSISCGDVVRQGTGSSYLIITRLEAAPGSSPDDFGMTLASDVVTVTDRQTGDQTIFDDIGLVAFQLALKDPGPPANPTTPSPANYITINRYRVQFLRADGRNTPGVDVPYPFDGAFTVTVQDTAEAGFILVRWQAKVEPPLATLRNNLNAISTIAEITFYGQDQTGRAVQATGRISVNFANHGDPE